MLWDPPKADVHVDVNELSWRLIYSDVRRQMQTLCNPHTHTKDIDVVHEMWWC